MTIANSTLEDVLQYILPGVAARGASAKRPFVLGLSGLQGSGKSTWAKDLVAILQNNYQLRAKTLSLDDLYHDHPALVSCREAHPGNGLLQTRGQPGTHDEELARRFFDDILYGSSAEKRVSEDSILWPEFDKSLNNGEGGRVPMSEWEAVPRNPPLDVLIFEGWCVGFQPLSPAAVTAACNLSAEMSLISQGQEQSYLTTNTLADHKLEDILLINDNLKRYCDTFMGPWRFDAFIHLSTDRLVNVYHWRLDQEGALWRAKGAGMTEQQVVSFVKGYMPAYELYLDQLTRGSVFEKDKSGQHRSHVRVVLNERREVVTIDRL